MTEQIEDTLKLKVTDFGPIVDAEIDLRPLTVFIGPSNTGKSYLAILIYALHQVFNRTARSLRRGYFPIEHSAFLNLSTSQIEGLLEVAQSIVSTPEADDLNNLALPAPVVEVIRSSLDGMADSLSNEIARCFGVGELHKFIRHGRTKKSQIAIKRESHDRDNPLQNTLSLARHSEFISTLSAENTIPLKPGGLVRYSRKELISSIQYMDRAKLDADDRKFLAMQLASSIYEMILPSLFGPLLSPAYYLPADRTGVMHAHSVVVSALIASAPAGGIRPAEAMPTLSGVLADFLNELIEIDRPKRGMRKKSNKNDIIAGKIEELILEGSVSITRSPHVNYPRFSYRPHGWRNDLALANASSMVSELAPVVLYLRHMIKPGNVLIVEEPESHLHPAMQVKFTRQLAALIRAGVRVIVTTHSEWLLEELANIVHRSRIPRAKRKGEIALREDDVGAWLFKPQRSPKGSVVGKVCLDESGLYSSGYNEVSETLHNDWADIASQIENAS